MREPTPAEAEVIARISAKMRASREALGISREQAAVLLGVDYSTIGRWERSEAAGGPPLSGLIAWADMCGVPLAELVE